MGFGGEELAVVKAVPQFIETIDENNPGRNFKISIVSWDDGLDFVYRYGDFSNKELRNAELIDVNDVARDIQNNPVFGENKDASYYYNCDELEETNISKAIDASIKIFENNDISDYRRVKRFIILVTDGDSGEFSECDGDLIEKAENAPYPIYVIGMNVVEGTVIFDHLKRLGGYDGNRIEFIYPHPKTLEDGLVEALRHAVKNATLAPVAENVTITETFYSYFNPDLDSIKVKGELHNSGGNVINFKNRTNNTIVFQLAGGVLPETETEISFDTELALMGLPISVNDQQSIPLNQIIGNYQESSLKYTWFNGEPFALELHDTPVNIELSRSKSAKSSEMRTTEGSGQPGNSNVPLGTNFGFIIILSFIIIFMVMMKRER